MTVETHLKFEETHNTGKTFRWNVLSGVSNLGHIAWYAPWRRYCFFTNGLSLFDRSCLMEIVDFIDGEMAKRKT
jgi:hypothetical protein